MEAHHDALVCIGPMHHDTPRQEPVTTAPSHVCIPVQDPGRHAFRMMMASE